MRTNTLLNLVICAGLLACGTGAEDASISYPPTAKSDQSDNYFGQIIKDPYRWLENDTSADTKAWVLTQNKLTFDYLDKIPFRARIRSRLDELLSYERRGAPMRVGEYYFFTRNSGLQNQDVIYRQKGLDGKAEVFLDPNDFSPDGTVTFSFAGTSQDDQYVTMAMSEGGSDWRTLVTYETANGKPAGDTVRWVKFSGATWSGSGFFYSRYPEPEKGLDYSASNSFHSVFYHKLGVNQQTDVLVYRDDENPGRYHYTDVTEDGAYVILYIAEGTNGFECHYRKAGQERASFTPLFTGFEHKSSVLDHREGRFVVRTDIDAPNYRLVEIDLTKAGQENWKDLIPEGQHLLQSVSPVGGKLIASYLENAQSKVYCFDPDGRNTKPIEMPASGSVYGFGGKSDDTLVFYTFSSFTYPGSIYSYDIRSGKSAVFFQPSLSFNSGDYHSEQVFYASGDGTKISMFVVYKKGLKQDGNNPCLLYGYGGFNISLTPHFSSARIPWLENGGIFAMPNLRGGGEYGEEWHQAGMLQNKQKVFDDFIAAAEFLIAEKYTSAEKLAITGRSNGGLLVGAVMTQRPDLFKVALPGVGVLDMLRYHKFTVGHGWIPEYGSSDKEDNFRNLLAYSPLHNVKEGLDYPATLLHTADHDDRVVPAHSYKFTAALQSVHKGRNPILIRIETKAGHGSGKPISKTLDEEADKLAFTFYNLGLKPYADN